MKDKKPTYTAEQQAASDLLVDDFGPAAPPPPPPSFPPIHPATQAILNMKTVEQPDNDSPSWLHSQISRLEDAIRAHRRSGCLGCSLALFLEDEMTPINYGLAPCELGRVLLHRRKVLQWKIADIFEQAERAKADEVQLAMFKAANGLT